MNINLGQKKEQYSKTSHDAPQSNGAMSFNSNSLADVQWGFQDAIFTTFIPSFIILFLSSRIFQWLRMRAKAALSFPRKPAWGLLVSASFAVSCGLLAFASYFGSRFITKTHSWLYIFLTIVTSVFSVIRFRSVISLSVIFLNSVFLWFVFWNGNRAGNHVSANTALAITFLCVVILNLRDVKRRLAIMEKSLQHKNEETVELSNENNFVVNFDCLTTLPNRKNFFSQVEEHFSIAKEKGGPLSIGIIDIDGFRPVNDIYGHGVGDQLLCAVGRRLAALNKNNIVIGRLGGDEFACLLIGIDDDKQLLAQGEMMADLVSAPYQIGRVCIRITASIGLASYPYAGADPGLLFEQANFAMQSSKKKGRGMVTVFSKEDEKNLKFFARVAYELMQADLAHELYLVCQPIVSCSAGKARIVGYEALARWESPALGKVSPDVFIGQAERCTLMDEISKLLFKKALREIAKLPSPTTLSFNLSVHDVVSEKFTDYVIKTLESYGVDPGRICVEITETSLVSDFPLAVKNLRKLRDSGLKVALDDFGTGYSSLSYVHQLPLDTIKIDKTFVSSLSENTSSLAIIKTIIDLSRNLKIACIVEGVENEEQLKSLLDLGANRFQGFFFGRPLPLSAQLSGGEQVLTINSAVGKNPEQAVYA